MDRDFSEGERNPGVISMRKKMRSARRQKKSEFSCKGCGAISKKTAECCGKPMAKC